MNEPMLVIHDLSFSYPNRAVLTRWSADIGPGITWLKGGNGSGKSTLLKLLAGALPAEHGAIRLRTTDLGQAPLRYRQQIFWCGPDRMPFDHLTPRAYWGFMRSLYATFDEALLHQHVAALALSPHLDRPLHALSTGTQRKVWVTAALCAGTPVTLMDEPLNALDATSLQHIRQTLTVCAQDTQRAWVLTSHEEIGSAGTSARVITL